MRCPAHLSVAVLWASMSIEQREQREREQREREQREREEMEQAKQDVRVRRERDERACLCVVSSYPGARSCTSVTFCQALHCCQACYCQNSNQL